MLEVREISKFYKKKMILENISFQAEPGQCIGIAGGNGCGKTTLLSILSGVNRPDGGSILFDGVEAVGNRRMFDKNAAYVPQENPLIPELSALDNYRLWFRGGKKEMERDLEEGVGHSLGLTKFLKTPAGKLSGGQKKRLSIASALSNQAAVLIMDEPGAALDLAAKEEILMYIRSYLEKGGTVILTSHETGELNVCTELYVLKSGILLPVSGKVSAGELVAMF